VTTLSVAMCTYSGEQCVEEQLASMRFQIRLPDEPAVCDDASTDSTPEVLRAFQVEAPLRVRIERNEERLGITPNPEGRSSDAVEMSARSATRRLLAHREAECTGGGSRGTDRCWIRPLGCGSCR